MCVGAEGFSTEEDQELLSRIEKQLKRRFVIGSQVSEHAIVQDFTRQVVLLNHCCQTGPHLSTAELVAL